MTIFELLGYDARSFIPHKRHIIRRQTMPDYTVRIDMPIDAETPEKAALMMLSWLQDTSDPLLPVVEVMNLDATIIIEEFDLSDFV